MTRKMYPNIVVIGYYGHENIGDEQYKITFYHLFKKFLPNYEKYTIDFIDCDMLKTKNFETTDIIIIGGGDILNDYFLDQINFKFNGTLNKILAVSVGLPYNELLINTKKLSIIDYIFIRTEQEMSLFTQYYRADRIFYLPDISYLLLETKEINQNSYCTNQLDRVKKSGKKIIAFCLNRHIYSKETELSYKNIVLEFATTIDTLIKQGYYIVLLPFNTVNKDDLNMENDILIHTDVYKKVNERLTDNILNIDFRLSVTETFNLFDYFYLTIPMRFHACLFSIYKKVPMIPVFTTKKIHNFLLDINWNIFYQLETYENDLPIIMDSKILLSMIKIISNRIVKTIYSYRTIKDYIILNDESYGKCQMILADACNNFEKKMNYEIQTVIDVITIPYLKEETMGFQNNAVNIINNLASKINEYVGGVGTHLDFKSSIFKDIRVRNNVVSMISYFLTNGFDSKYNHGLFTKMFDEEYYDYKEEWAWIIKDLHSFDKNKIKINSYESGLFNMSFVDQIDYSNSHRSGWQYVIHNLKKLNNENSGIYMDLSIDKTFHWKEDINKILGIIPYKQDWVGFIHHTFDTTFSKYNNTELLKKESFRESLKCCKCIFVLSYTLRLQMIDQLYKTGCCIPPIHVLCHPTEFSIKPFSWKNFINNKDKKLINIGGWLRNIFSFYNLSIPTNYFFRVGGNKRNFICNKIRQLWHPIIKGTIRKSALKGYHMDNYYPHIDNNYSTNDDDIIKNCSHNGSNINNHEIIKNCSHNGGRNNWELHFDQHTKKMIESIEVIERLSNEEYDDLLTENIVFLNLVDGSAMNTVIESIIRNTPIVINRIPCVVEILGPDYPLYYGDSEGNTNDTYKMNYQITNLLTDTRNIKSAYKYLLSMDKRKFDIDFFISQLTNIMRQI